MIARMKKREKSEISKAFTVLKKKKNGCGKGSAKRI
jgi:hypothetical protein